MRLMKINNFTEAVTGNSAAMLSMKHIRVAKLENTRVFAVKNANLERVRSAIDKVVREAIERVRENPRHPSRAEHSLTLYRP